MKIGIEFNIFNRGYCRYGDKKYIKLKEHGFSCIDFNMSNTNTVLYTSPASDELLLREKMLADEAGIEGKDSADKAKKFIKSIQDFNAKMGIPARFEKLEEKDFDELADRILAEANPLYPVPREMDREDVMRMLKHLQA